MALSASYEKLQDHEETESEQGYPVTPSLSRSWKTRFFYPLILLLLASNIFTWFASEWRFKRERILIVDGRSPYAELPRDVPVALDAHSPYSQPNETARNELWEAINIDAGMIAVSDSFVEEKDLPESQRFVWDQSKSVYLLNGHHTLHCVRAVYISLMEFWQSKPQSRRWEHVIHCVDQLRQEALCNADDTPRYSTSDDIPVSGVGQVRMCRSWNKLEEWAKQYNACYRYVNQTASYKDFPQIERFVWCPKGSPYKKEVEKVFGPIEWSQ